MSADQMRIQDSLGILATHDILCCPRCKGKLEIDQNRLKCLKCAHSYPITDNIPQLFCPTDWEKSKTDVTEEIKAFYEKTPFPNYDEFDSIGTLVDKARRRVFGKLLDDQIPYGTRIIECGCGTGQLTNFLSVAGRTAFGTDMCLNSLRMAQKFKEKNDLKRAHFFQMNLFRPCFAPGKFDLVICNGVLHHTGDPFLGFRTIATLVKPRGYIMISLYHKYGRLTTDLRRGVFRLTRDRLRGLDPRMHEKISEARKTAWYMDQYKNPHESKHTIGEVLGWLKETGFSFVKSIPKTVPLAPFKESEKLFVKDELGGWLSRSIVELGMMVTASRDGGLFILIAQKNDN
jgi:SAM-dependent methyltransferase